MLTVASTEPLQQRLRELGYVEGQNIALDVREKENSSDSMNLRSNLRGSRST